ncbi:MurR/RpiR family transcriptional regulator [Bacillus sp. ISL-40]|uniref:MurR/RpiR family transcriptional regulator n=1 Tax=unclassified Bacillus (in: firmicutes) TaxID=185979 RepID=UPI001BECB188|nr:MULTISPECIES: MurR/RpiR family transcriptional regulator [unclassified Bacillus (in: firmicutes)]MBT2701356.1 MurR/RpiR family transcriptional regulator [Bacillus sp. ISL-40]MBT2719701.1 MurR/RpiR family transcriptional regulator [Bacillus sp. ISL-46]MBT2742142.1 MurR/RpiR family transcriptional regulator [Bacillus sp. ISL-77]
MSLDNPRTTINKIVDIKDSLPKKQRQLCDYILKNHQSIGLITIKELASNAKVGISTVMRTVNTLGYENFNDLRKDIYDESFPSESRWTLKNSITDIQKEGGSVSTLVQVWKESVNLLNKSLDSNLMENFENAIDFIVKSSYINVLGTRPYKATALYFELLLGEFYPRIRQLGHDTEVIYDRILQFEKDEILVVFAFEPYTNRIIEAVKLAYELGHSIILITDHISCPIISYASVTLKVEVSEEQFSVIPIIALLDALVIEIGKRTSEESIKKLKRLEKTLIEKNVLFSY